MPADPDRRRNRGRPAPGPGRRRSIAIGIAAAVVRHRRDRRLGGAMAAMRPTTRPRASRIGPRSGRGVVQSRRTAELAAAAKTAKEDASAKAGRPPTVIPEGSAGLADKSDGILLRYNLEKREWERLLKDTPLKPGDRILCLDPFRAWIDLGKIRIGMVGETEVRVLSPGADQVPVIEIVAGPHPGPRAGVEDAQGRLRQAVADPGPGSRHRARY